MLLGRVPSSGCEPLQESCFTSATVSHTPRDPDSLKFEDFGEEGGQLYLKQLSGGLHNTAILKKSAEGELGF